jgi:hypothetical protein
VTEPEEYLGKTAFDFLSWEKAAEYFAEKQAIIQTGQPMLNKEHLSFTPDNSPLWTVTSKLPLCDTAENIIGTIGMGNDITSRKRAEAERLALEIERERCYSVRLHQGCFSRVQDALIRDQRRCSSVG